jgi:hypothetical protein
VTEERWEYREVKTADVVDHRGFVNGLNAEGERGWQLACAVHDVMILRRPVGRATGVKPKTVQELIDAARGLDPFNEGGDPGSTGVGNDERTRRRLDDAVRVAEAEMKGLVP